VNSTTRTTKTLKETKKNIVREGIDKQEKIGEKRSARKKFHSEIFISTIPHTNAPHLNILNRENFLSHFKLFTHSWCTGKLFLSLG